MCSYLLVLFDFLFFLCKVNKFVLVDVIWIWMKNELIIEFIGNVYYVFDGGVFFYCILWLWGFIYNEIFLFYVKYVI